jgi:putative solute:sodium symporter small subunit
LALGGGARNGGNVAAQNHNNAFAAQETNPMQLTDRQRAYWRNNLQLTAALMSLWFVATFVVIFYAREWSFSFFGWPFSFWMGAQGALILYCVLVWVYAVAMNRLDHRYGLVEQGD